jgi:hypothetical protein
MTSAAAEGQRVVAKEKLTDLRDSAHKLAVGLADRDTFRGAHSVARRLSSLGLTPEEFMKRVGLAHCSWMGLGDASPRPSGPVSGDPGVEGLEDGVDDAVLRCEA